MLENCVSFGSHGIRFEVFTAEIMKTGVFWDVSMPLGISSQRASVASYS
jgi:hypothetical protein